VSASPAGPRRRVDSPAHELAPVAIRPAGPTTYHSAPNTLMPWPFCSRQRCRRSSSTAGACCSDLGGAVAARDGAEERGLNAVPGLGGAAAAARRRRRRRCTPTGSACPCRTGTASARCRRPGSPRAWCPKLRPSPCRTARYQPGGLPLEPYAPPPELEAPEPELPLPHPAASAAAAASATSAMSERRVPNLLGW
jgi:hypothetical protein